MMQFLRLAKWELVKQLRRRRTYLGFAAFLAVEAVFLALLGRPDVESVARRQIEGAGYTFDANYSALTVAHFVVVWTISILGALYVALVGGDSVAGEVEEGTMRMLLCQPVSRGKILGVKFVSCVAYAGILTAFIGGTTLALSLAWIGPGRFFVYNLKENVVESHPFWQGLQIYCFEAMPLLALSMATIASVAFFFSCLKLKPAVASAGALSVFLIDEMLRGVPFFENVRHLFLTDRTASWIRVYLMDPPWGRIARDYGELLAVDLALFVIGLWVFGRRDLKP